MGTIIAVVNQKGGVGKTTTAVNLAAALGDLGLRVLVCDFDPQANATSGFGIDKRKVKHTSYGLIIEETTAAEAIVHTDFCDVIPSSADLAGAGVELIGMEHREKQLRKALEEVRDNYDVVQCEYYALEGLSDLMATLRSVKRKLNQTLDIFGVVLTMFDGRTNFSTQVAQEVRRHFPGKVFTTVIPRNVRLAEAPSHGLPVTAYDRSSRGAVAYRELAQEVAAKLKR